MVQVYSKAAGVAYVAVGHKGQSGRVSVNCARLPATNHGDAYPVHA